MAKVQSPCSHFPRLGTRGGLVARSLTPYLRARSAGGRRLATCRRQVCILAADERAGGTSSSVSVTAENREGRGAGTGRTDERLDADCAADQVERHAELVHP